VPSASGKLAICQISDDIALDDLVVLFDFSRKEENKKAQPTPHTINHPYTNTKNGGIKRGPSNHPHTNAKTRGDGKKKGTIWTNMILLIRGT
jgi:hypothetical protein